MEDSPQKRSATVPMRKIRHTTVIGWGWVGRVGVRGVGELGSKGWGELGIPQPQSPDLTPPTSTLPDHKPPTQPPNSIDPNPPNFHPPNPNPTPIYHRCVANLPHRRCCKRLSDSYAQILGHIRCVANLLWRIFRVANPLATANSNNTCQRHGLAVPRAGNRSYVTGSTHGWSRLHLTYVTGGC